MAAKNKNSESLIRMFRESASFYTPKYSIPQYFNETKIFDRFDDAIQLYYSSDIVSQSLDFLVSTVLKSITPDIVSNEKLRYIISDFDFRNSLRDVVLSYFALSNAFGLISYKRVRLSKQVVYVPIISTVPPTSVAILGPSTSPTYGIIYPAEVVYKFKEWQRSGRYEEFVKQLALDKFFERPADKTDYEPILDNNLRAMLEAKKDETLIVKDGLFFAVRMPSFSRYAEPLLAKLLSKIEMINLIPNAKASFYAAATITILLLKTTGSKAERERIINTFFNEVKNNNAKVVSLAVPENYDVSFESGWSLLNKDVGISDVEYFVDLVIKEILGTGIEKNYKELQESIYSRVNQFTDVLNKILFVAAEKNSLKPETVSELTVVIRPPDIKTLAMLKQQGLISASKVLASIGTSVAKELDNRITENELKFEETMMPKYQPYQGKYSILKSEEDGGDADE